MKLINYMEKNIFTILAVGILSFGTGLADSGDVLASIASTSVSLGVTILIMYAVENAVKSWMSKKQ
ncbi:MULTISPECIES: hypothetical protein [Bacillus cereus group]|uniref:Uncharacterized protein n=1 Tax=Bacillus thuringiensis TaxID=1428 RepID=A0A9X7FXW4_BACTU|nr:MULTISPECIES: hypothetical protein [Bacillus cereus group]PFT50831.1 hypothetical protein COK72_02155 [Bacillus thuringiensis]PFY22868.1 hypothetical protein COL44_18475 [Bacillus toyonensis]